MADHIDLILWQIILLYLFLSPHFNSLVFISNGNKAAVCSFRPISTVSLLLSYWLFFERSISHLLWLSCYLSSHPCHRVPTLSSNLLRCLCSVFSGTLSFVYPIQIVVVSDDTTTVCPHLFVFYLPSTKCSPPLSSTTESDSVFYSRCLP